MYIMENFSNFCGLRSPLKSGNLIYTSEILTLTVHTVNVEIFKWLLFRESTRSSYNQEMFASKNFARQARVRNVQV